MSSLLAPGGIAGLVPRSVPERAALDVAMTRTTTSKRLSWMRFQPRNRKKYRQATWFPLRPNSARARPLSLRVKAVGKSKASSNQEQREESHGINP